MSPPPPEECANCGAAIPRTAKACPVCGADDRTGWRETDTYDDLDLPAEAWRDEDPATVTQRKPGARHRDVNGIAWYWWCAGIALIALLVLGGLRLL